MPKQINTAGVGQRLVKLFALKGRFQPVLDEVIVPVVSVDAEEVEQRPAGSNAFVGAGGAGTYTCVVLQNPSGSGKIVRLEWFSPFATSNQVNIYPNLSILSGGLTGANEFWEDLRLPGVPAATVSTSVTTTVPTSAAAIVTPYLAIGANWIPPTPWVLGPGDAVVFQLTTANTAFGGSLAWTEQDEVAS